MLGVAVRAHDNLGVVWGDEFGGFRAGRDHCRRAAELNGKMGQTTRQIFTLFNVAEFSILLGELGHAEETLSQMQQLRSEITEPARDEHVDRKEIYLLVTRGEWAQAARRVRALQANAREWGVDMALATADIRLAWVLLESHRFEPRPTVGDQRIAETILAEAIAIFDRSSLCGRSIETRTMLGALCIFQGRLAEARRLLHEAKGWVGVRPGAFEAHAARGEPGDLKRAGALLGDAQAAFEDMGAPRYAAVAQERREALTWCTDNY